jgi:hypothetical protein
MASASPPNPDTTSSAAAANPRPWGVALLWLLPVMVVVLILAYGGLTRMSNSHYDPVPPNVQKQLMEAYKPRVEEE